MATGKKAAGLADMDLWRVLAMDGGGLYGLTTALWLKQLCQGSDSFLHDRDVRLFAGTSAGALNALLLAREKDPRSFVLRGGLEDFYRQPGTFSNSNPVTALLSLYQVTAWFGAGDFLSLLQSEFGDMTLGDLPHDVFISSFNWTGTRNAADPAPGSAAPPPGPPPGSDVWSAWAAACGIAPYPAPPNPADVVATQSFTGWRPKFFKNFPAHEPDRRRRVVDVAYAAATPPGYRAVLDGFGDGGTFNACPAAEVTAAVIDYEKERQDRWDFDLVRDVCSRTRVLSLGVGAKMPAYWLKLFDLSALQFAYSWTNPPQGNWWSPLTNVTLEAPTEDAVYIATQLLGPNFHRMNPGLLELPTSVAVILSRFPAAREWLTREIEAVVKCPASLEAVARTLVYLKDVWDLPLAA
jgi:Patatin-like phospholipase